MTTQKPPVGGKDKDMKRVKSLTKKLNALTHNMISASMKEAFDLLRDEYPEEQHIYLWSTLATARTYIMRNKVSRAPKNVQEAANMLTLLALCS